MKSRSSFGIVALLALALAAGAAAQSKDDKKREAQLRTVRGTVVDRDENPVAGVVFLKNMKTQTVRTHIAGDDGSYRFSGLDPNVDYEIHAEHDDLASNKRTISSFDSRKEIVVILKLSRKREK